MIVLIVVDQKLAKQWLLPVLRGVQKTLQAAATVLKRLAAKPD